MLQLAHTRAFVVGVFRSLQACRSVHPLDVQWAIDLCDEQPLEIDITDFLKVGLQTQGRKDCADID